jgi:hypothetical protein
VREAVKRAISVAFVVGLVMLFARTCETEAAECTLVFRVAPASAAEVLEARARLLDDDGEVIGTFRYVQGKKPRTELGRWPLQVPASDYILELELETAAGRASHERKVTLSDRAEVTVHLDDYLAAPAQDG